LPEYRGKGLGKKLTLKAIEWCKKDYDFIFLFADEDAVPFYRKQNFLFQKEYKYVVEMQAVQRKPGIQKLDMNNKEHLQILYKYAQGRTSVSDKIGILNEKLLMFHALYLVRDLIYYIPDLEIILFYSKKGNKFIFYDIIGKELTKFSDIFPYISDNKISFIEFLFMPDKLELANFKTTEFSDNQLYIYNSSPFNNEKIIFPFTSHA